MCPLCLTINEQKSYSYENAHLFLKRCQDSDKFPEYQNYLQCIVPGYINLSPRDASKISSGCAKTKLGLSWKKNKKHGGKVAHALFLNFDWPIVQV